MSVLSMILMFVCWCVIGLAFKMFEVFLTAKVQQAAVRAKSDEIVTSVYHGILNLALKLQDLRGDFKNGEM